MVSIHFQEPPYPARCFPDPCLNITFTNASYVCGDSRLGPVELPKDFPLSTETATYARFGNLCPYEFLEKWTYHSGPYEGKYHYPDFNGSVIDSEGNPIMGDYVLPVGRKVDRFGYENGNFLGPLGAPYIERALPPSNLNTYDNSFPYDYYVYEVIKEFTVYLSPITPWFEQPGMGTQFYTADNISVLVDNQNLRRLDRSEYDQRADFADNYTPGPDNS
ncbi:hypothetical protein N7523_000339 [Penicillium sp. IBT 18751x]|nr:hypothetical protein N7523_000339 [Penicillium sp. IBT 18751x]